MWVGKHIFAKADGYGILLHLSCTSSFFNSKLGYPFLGGSVSSLCMTPSVPDTPPRLVEKLSGLQSLAPL
jgi:hypothetical protein